MKTQKEILDGQIETQRAIVDQLARMSNDLIPLMVQPDKVGAGKASEISAEVGRRHQAARERLDLLEKELAGHIEAFEADRRRHERENGDWWFRRFHTSLAIAHGAAFAAIASNAFDADKIKTTAALVAAPLATFGIGMILAGLIPVTSRN